MSQNENLDNTENVMNIDENNISSEDFELDNEEEETNETQENNETNINLDATLNETDINSHNLLHSGWEDGHKYIFQYLQTGNINFLNLDEIKFDLYPGITDKEKEFYNILIEFQKYLIKIKTYSNSKNRKSLVNFPFLYSKSNRRTIQRKNKNNIEGMSDVHSLIAHGLLDEALNKCLQVMKAHPCNKRVLNMLSYLYNELGDIENSLKFTFSAALISKTDPILFHYVGMLFIKHGYIDRGIGCLENAIRFVPRYIPAYWELACQLFLKQSYLRMLYVIMSFLRYPIKEHFTDHYNLLKLVVLECLKTKSGIKRILAYFEVFLSNISPEIDSELFTIYCQLMISHKMYKELFKGFFKILVFPKNFLDEIKLEELDLEAISNWLTYLTYLKEDILVYFTVSLIFSYPKSNFIKPLLKYLKCLQLEQNYLIIILDALCANKSFDYALETNYVTYDYINENNNLKMHVILYYLTNDHISKAYEYSSYLSFKSTPYYFHLLSGVFSIILNLDDQILSYFLLFYQEFLHDKVLRSEIAQAFHILIKKYPQLIDNKSDKLSSSLFITTCIIYLEFEEMKDLGITCDIYKIHLIRVLNSFVEMGYEFTIHIMQSIDMVTKFISNEEVSYNKNINFELMFIKISIMIKFKKYIDAYNTINDLLLNFDKNLIINHPAFYNLLAFVNIHIDKLFDKRRLIRIFEHFKHENRFEYHIITIFLFNKIKKHESMLKSSFSACRLARNNSLPFLIHAINLFDYSFSKGQYDNLPIITQSFIFFMIYFKKSGGLDSLEACYNIGRFFHSFGYFSYAENFYRRALSINSSENNYIKRVAAFNLALIYEKSNNRYLANTILRTYLTF